MLSKRSPVKLKVRKTNVTIFLLALIVLIGFILRFHQLAENPPGLDWDEANAIYNGYSIATTGKDEFIKPYPFLFRALNGFVPPVLIYLDSLSVKLFGLNEFAARFPTAFLGTLSIIGIYWLVLLAGGDKKLALITGLLLAVSPWHIGYSRVGTFAGLPLVFVIFGSCFFIKGVTRHLYLIPATILFVTSILSYFSAYVFMPMYVFSLVIIFRKHVTKFLSILVLCLTIIAASLPFILPGGQTRANGIYSFTDPDLIKKDAFYALEESGGKLLHNRRLVYLQKIFAGYFAHFQYSFLFDKGDAVTRMVVSGPGFGLLYWCDLPFLLTGGYLVFRQKKQLGLLFLIWLVYAAIPAAPTLPLPASTRTTLMIPPLIYFIASGWRFVVFNRGKVIQIIFILLFGLNIHLYLHQYFVHFPKEKTDEWFAAYEPLFEFLSLEENIQKQVTFAITQPGYLDQAYIFTAFYDRIDPKEFQNSGGTRLEPTGTTGKFSVGRYHFLPMKCETCENDEIVINKGLIVSAHKLIDQPKKVFLNNDKNPVLYVYDSSDVPIELIKQKLL